MELCTCPGAYFDMTTHEGKTKTRRPRSETRKRRLQRKVGDDGNLNAWRSENDQKDYRLVKLANGLSCILVSAENADPKRKSENSSRVIETGSSDINRLSFQSSGGISNAQKRISSSSKRLSTSSQHSHRSSASCGSQASHHTSADTNGPDKRLSQRNPRRTSALVRNPEGPLDCCSSMANEPAQDDHSQTGIRKKLPVLPEDPCTVSPPGFEVHGNPDADLQSNHIASVCMAVGVGSFSEPDCCEGLAHFVEHMLFMGSEKYPRENEFDSFLSQNGGSNNAYTDTERTVYYFSCFQKDLYKATDIFAQFFISPLMLEEAAEREVNSIESEFSIHMNVDYCRHLEIWRYTSRPGTPFSRFTCGNEESLVNVPRQNGVNVHEELRKFHDRYYVAPNMRLVIVGYSSLDELQEMAEELFAAVREGSDDPDVVISPTIKGVGAPWRMGFDNHETAKRLAQEGISDLIVGPDLVSDQDLTSYLESESDEAGVKSKYTPEGLQKAAPPEFAGVDGVSLGCVFGFDPVTDEHIMALTWQIPPQFEKNRSHASRYVANLLGHESDGSILAFLKVRGWATRLDSSCSSDLGGFQDTTSCSLLLIQIHLTVEGMINWIYVISLVFEYIGILQRDGPQKWLYEEDMAISAMHYRFKEDEDYGDLAEALAVRMLPQAGIDDDQLLDGPTRLEWNPEEIGEILNYCRPELLRIDLRSSIWSNSSAPRLPPALARRAKPLSNFDTQNVTVRVEPYTSTTFWAQRIPQEVLDLWNSLLDGSKVVRHVFDSLDSTQDPSPLNLFQPSDQVSTHDDSTPDETYITTFIDQLSRGVIEPRDDYTLSALWIPHPNPYVPSDFTLLSQNEKLLDLAKSGDFQGCRVSTTRVAYIRHKIPLEFKDEYSWMEKLLYSSTKEKSSLNDEVTLRGKVERTIEIKEGSVIFHDVELCRILVDYGSGLYQWHQILDPDASPKRKIISIDGPGFSLQVLQDPKQLERPSLLRKSKASMSRGASSSGRASLSVSSSGDLKPTKPRRALSLLRKKNKLLRDLSKGATIEDGIPPSVLTSIWSNFPKVRSDPFEFSMPALVQAPLLETGEIMPGLRLWYMTDRVNLVPRTEINLRFVNHLPSIRAQFTVLVELLGRLWYESVRNDAFYAYIAGIELSIDSDEEGLYLNLSGISAHIVAFLDRVFGVLARIASSCKGYQDSHIQKDNHDDELEYLASQEEFKGGSTISEKGEPDEKLDPLYSVVPRKVFAAQLIGLYQDYGNEASHFMNEGPVSAALYKILVHGSWQPEVCSMLVRDVRPWTLSEFAAVIMHRSEVEVCLSGNVDADMALEAHQILSRYLNEFRHEGLPPTSMPEVNVLEVPHARINPHRDDPWRSVTGLVHPLEALEFQGHSVDLYFQLGPDDLETRLLAEMIEYLIKEPIYAELRSKKQLGYVVQASTVTVQGIVGFVVDVTSKNFPPHEIAALVDDFLAEFYEGLKVMNIEEFHENVCALARTKLDEGRGVRTQGSRLWEAITLEPYRSPPQYEWKSSSEEIEVLRSFITRKRVLSAYAQWLLPSSTQRRRVSVLVFGAGYEGSCMQELMSRAKYVSIVDSEFIYKSTPNCMFKLRDACVPTLRAQERTYHRRHRDAVCDDEGSQDDHQKGCSLM